jgi:hypothetical protein
MLGIGISGSKLDMGKPGASGVPKKYFKKIPQPTAYRVKY